MTNENIIKQLKRLIPSLQYADDVNAVKAAIQALSQEGGYCCRTCKHTRINKDGIWCEEPTCQWEQAVTNSEAQEPCEECKYKTFTELYFHTDPEMVEQEPCDDAISRKDAEQMFRNIRGHLKPQDYKSAEEFNTRDLMLLNAEQMIHALPSVTHKSGKWIDYRDDGFVECPFCGHATNCEDNIDELHYCFYCGACMKDGRTLDEFIEDSKAESEE